MEKADKQKDVIAFVGEPAADGSIAAVRMKDDRIEVGVLSPQQEGRPIHSELVRVSPSQGRWHEVETLYDGRRDSGRPAMVNSTGYRSGWDAVFGGDKSALN